MINPALLNTSAISHDAKERALSYRSHLETPMGAYTSNSKGFNYVREKIADFIVQRDNVPHADAKDIYLTNGAGEGVRIIFSMLVRN